MKAAGILEASPRPRLHHRRFGGTCSGCHLPGPCAEQAVDGVESDEGPGRPWYCSRLAGSPRARAPRGSDPNLLPIVDPNDARRAPLDRSKRTSSSATNAPGTEAHGCAGPPLRRVCWWKTTASTGESQSSSTSWDHRVESTPDGAVAAVLTGTSVMRVLVTSRRRPCMGSYRRSGCEARTGRAGGTIASRERHAETAADGGDGRARCSSRSIATSASGTVTTSPDGPARKDLRWPVGPHQAVRRPPHFPGPRIQSAPRTIPVHEASILSRRRRGVLRVRSHRPGDRPARGSRTVHG